MQATVYWDDGGDNGKSLGGLPDQLLLCMAASLVWSYGYYPIAWHHQHVCGWVND